MKCRRTAACK